MARGRQGTSTAVFHVSSHGKSVVAGTGKRPRAHSSRLLSCRSRRLWLKGTRERLGYNVVDVGDPSFESERGAAEGRCAP